MNHELNHTFKMAVDSFTDLLPLAHKGVDIDDKAEEILALALSAVIDDTQTVEAIMTVCFAYAVVVSASDGASAFVRRELLIGR